MHLGVFVSTPCISDGSVFLYFHSVLLFYTSQMLVESEDEKWIYASSSILDSLPMCCFCFLEGTSSVCIAYAFLSLMHTEVYERRLF